MPKIDRPFIRTSPNRDRIRHKVVRDSLDLRFEDAHNELSEAYYGKDDGSGGLIEGWRHGTSAPWQGFDVQATLTESKTLFDALHGLIWTHYDVDFHTANLALPVDQRIPEREYNIIFEKDDEGRTVNVGRRKHTEAQTRIDAQAALGRTITIA